MRGDPDRGFVATPLYGYILCIHSLRGSGDAAELYSRRTAWATLHHFGQPNSFLGRRQVAEDHIYEAAQSEREATAAQVRQRRAPTFSNLPP